MVKKKSTRFPHVVSVVLTDMQHVALKKVVAIDERSMAAHRRWLVVQDLQKRGYYNPENDKQLLVEDDET